MRIALIAHNLRGGGGISVGRNLIAAIGRVAPHHDYFATMPADLGYEDICLQLRSCALSIFRHTSYLKRWWYDAQMLPRQLTEFHADVVLGLGNSTVVRTNAPQAMLCHDSHLWYSKKHFAEEGLSSAPKHAVRLLKRSRFRRSLARAELVFCQTETASSRLRTTYAYNGMISLCPNAVSMFAQQESDKSESPDFLKSYQHRTKLFCLARYYPHKNLEMLVHLFDRYREKLKDHVVFITISSDQHPSAGKLLANIKRLGLEDSIVNVGPLAQSQIGAYYKHCDALILPTLLESFSATYIEAMYFGCPILTSDLDFAHEVCGDAAIYFDPWQPASVLKAIQSLPIHADLPKRGRERMDRFFRSWDQVAADVLDSLYSIVGSN